MFTFNTFKYVNLKFICTKIKLESEGFFFFILKNICITWTTQILPVGSKEQMRN